MPELYLPPAQHDEGCAMDGSLDFLQWDKIVQGSSRRQSPIFFVLSLHCTHLLWVHLSAVSVGIVLQWHVVWKEPGTEVLVWGGELSWLEMSCLKAFTSKQSKEGLQGEFPRKCPKPPHHPKWVGEAYSGHAALSKGLGLARGSSGPAG